MLLLWIHTSIFWVTLLFSSSDTKSWNTKLQPKFSASVLYFCCLTNSLEWTEAAVSGQREDIQAVGGQSRFWANIYNSKYLKSVLVTEYLSILNGWRVTARVGDFPSLPSAALVPISIFPPGINTISSTAKTNGYLSSKYLLRANCGFWALQTFPQFSQNTTFEFLQPLIVWFY